MRPGAAQAILSIANPAGAVGALLAVVLLLALLSRPAVAGTTLIYQTNETEPNGDFASATPVNDNTGPLSSGFQLSDDYDFYRVTVVESNAQLTVEAVGALPATDTALVVFNSAGSFLAVNDDYNGSLNAKIVNLALPTPGDYYIWVFESTGKGGPGVDYTLTGQLVEPDIVDVTPPFYEIQGGALAADWIGPDTIEVFWAQAIDDISNAAAIRYNVYMATRPDDVFSGPPILTLVDELRTDVSGLDGFSYYYFGVRAEDEADNEDSNISVAGVLPLTAANPAIWSVYE